jgi:hypothetical protein
MLVQVTRTKYPRVERLLGIIDEWAYERRKAVRAAEISQELLDYETTLEMIHYVLLAELRLNISLSLLRDEMHEVEMPEEAYKQVEEEYTMSDDEWSFVEALAGER